MSKHWKRVYDMPGLPLDFWVERLRAGRWETVSRHRSFYKAQVGSCEYLRKLAPWHEAPELRISTPTDRITGGSI